MWHDAGRTRQPDEGDIDRAGPDIIQGRRAETILPPNRKRRANKRADRVVGEFIGEGGESGESGEGEGERAGVVEELLEAE